MDAKSGNVRIEMQRSVHVEHVQKWAEAGRGHFFKVVVAGRKLNNSGS
jgi:hypothetical protein